MSRTSKKKESAGKPKKKERQILFLLGEDRIVFRLPYDKYEPGDIKELREKLAEKMNCALKEVKIRIVGL